MLYGAGHLPPVHHSEQPIKLQPAVQPTFQHSIRPGQDTILSTEVPSHEGRLLQLADQPLQIPANTNLYDSFQQDLENALSGADLLADGVNLSGDDDSDHHATATLHGHSKSADLEQHELAMDEAISRKAAGKPHLISAQAAVAAAESAFNEADSRSEGQDTAPQHADNSTGDSHITGKDMLGLVGLSADPASTTDASHTNSHPVTHMPKHVANHTHHLRHKAASNHTSSAPAHPTCSIHKDLPMPGTDIAPTDKNRCYTHPQMYKNNNYLNDSYYMLYHHDDIPTAHPHPAFTWGDIGRFAQVSHKMRRKDPVTVTFVGGSVSSSYCQDPVVTCWVAPVSAWLREHNPAVQIINNAVGGTTSRTTAECFDAMVGKDADLIFLEYSYNDRWELASCPVGACAFQ